MNSFAGKRVLITGGLGFIGSTLAIRLVREGAEVSICDAMIEGYGGNFENIREIRSDVSVHLADVRDEAAMGKLVEACDVVFHLAAQVSHVMSLSNPYPDIDINIKGTAAVLEACRKKNRDALVVRSGTRGQYGPAVRLPVSEDALSDPRGLLQKLAARVDAQSAGLPVGAQIVGRPWADERVLAAMAALEEEVRSDADFPNTPHLPA